MNGNRNTAWMHIMRCPGVKAWTQYAAQCVCNICTGLCFFPGLWSSVLALIRQLGTEWEHIKNQPPFQADGSSLWQGQSARTQACYSCAMLRKLGLGGLGFGFCFFGWVFSSFNSYKWVSTHKYRHTCRKLQGTQLFHPWLAGEYWTYIYNHA